MEIWISIVAFALFYLYEVNEVRWHNPKCKSLFFIGSSLLFGAMFLPIQGTILFFHKVSTWIGLALLVPSVILLVITLFFSFPFDQGYVKGFDPKPVYQEKMYALSRHPGVIWFVVLFGSLVLIYPTERMILLALVQSSLNILYVFVQDVWFFPKRFINYESYKQNTPFLLPSTKSILSTIQSFKRR